MTTDKCDLCFGAGPLHLHAKCHDNAPLHATLEGGEIVLRCYVPSCMREVARYKINQGFPEKFAMQNTLDNQAAEIHRLQAELSAVRDVLAKANRQIRGIVNINSDGDWIASVRFHDLVALAKTLDATIDAARRE